LLETCGAPTITSTRPSPLTSPALATLVPNSLLAPSGAVNTGAGVAAAPLALPMNTSTTPAKLFAKGAPTSVSEYPSPLTSRVDPHDVWTSAESPPTRNGHVGLDGSPIRPPMTRPRSRQYTMPGGRSFIAEVVVS